MAADWIFASSEIAQTVEKGKRIRVSLRPMSVVKKSLFEQA